MKKPRGQGIVKVSELFKKYKQTLRAPQATVIQEFRGIVYEELGVEIKIHQCAYTPQSRTLVLTVGGPLKTEIILRKKQILKKLTDVLGEKSAPRQLL